jgi:endonuclease-8
MRLRAALAGEELLRTDFRVPRLATVDLGSRRVDDIFARGKHLLFRFSGGVTLHTHFRMDGAWHLYRRGDKWRGPAWQVRAVLETNPWLAVGFRLPVVEVLETAREADVVGHLGPDPLSNWDAEEALRRLRADPQRTISSALLDQRNLSGIGNIYRCEICFLRGLNPWTRVTAVPALEKVVDLVKRLFEANRGRAGHVTTGDPRRSHAHWVYGRGGQPCRRCGTVILKRQAAGGPEDERLTFWCPHCQPSQRA